MSRVNNNNANLEVLIQRSALAVIVRTLSPYAARTRHQYNTVGACKCQEETGAKITTSRQRFPVPIGTQFIPNATWVIGICATEST